MPQSMKGGRERTDPLHPKPDSERESDRVINNASMDKTLLQFRRGQHRLNDGGVIPNVEGASQNLGDKRRQRGDEQRVAATDLAYFVGNVHGRK